MNTICKTSLTQSQIEAGFIRSVTSFENSQARWRQRAETGLTDDDLIEALKHELGEFGGTSGYDNIPPVTHTKTRLRIWIGEGHNHCTDTPTLQDKQTMQMARQIFNIANPEDKQMGLF